MLGQVFVNNRLNINELYVLTSVLVVMNDDSELCDSIRSIMGNNNRGCFTLAAFR